MMANIDPGNPNPEWKAPPMNPEPSPTPVSPYPLSVTNDPPSNEPPSPATSSAPTAAYPPPAEPPVEAASPGDVEAADKAATDAQIAADEARAKAEATKVAAMAAAQSRADAAEAAKPKWETIHEATNERTERLITSIGYFLRSVWSHNTRSAGGTPLAGSSMTFVPGEAPPMRNTSALALSVADLQPGVDPATATLAGVYPVTQLADASTVLLFLPDGKVRVLKSPDPTLVGVTRDATPADGVAP